MVQEIKVGTDYFIGALGNSSGSNGIAYQFFDGTSIENQYTNHDFCIRLHVKNRDREKFFIRGKAENCWTTNYCLCEKF